MKCVRLVLAMSALLALTGCGFHFRQAPNLPASMRHIYIAVPGGNGGLLRELRRDLGSDDTDVLATPEGSTATLSVISVTHSSRPQALSRTGQALEYRVTYQVEFSLVVLGATIMEPQVIALQRNYTYNISNAVANEEQEQNLNNAISKDVAQFIVYRVIAAARTLPPSLMAAPATSPTPAAAVPAAATVSTPAAATQAPPV